MNQQLTGMFPAGQRKSASWAVAFVVTALFLADGAAFLTAHVIGWSLAAQLSAHTLPFLTEFAFIILVPLTWCAIHGHYRPGQGLPASTIQLWMHLGAVFALFAGIYALAAEWQRIISLAVGLGASAVLIPLTRYALICVFRIRGMWSIPTVIAGDPEATHRIAQAIRNAPSAGYHLIEEISFETIQGPALMGMRAAHPGRPFDYLTRRYGSIRNILFILPLDANHAIGVGQLLPVFQQAQMQVAFAPLTSEISLPGLKRRHLTGLRGALFIGHQALPSTPTPLAPSPALTRFKEAVKRSLDICGALTGLILAAPVFLIVTPLICLDGGPAFFAQTRIGRHGKRFQCLKFRTMVTDADERLRDLLARDVKAANEWMRDQKLHNDPRITRLGAFLRRSSLDELPQLLNILRGDMSLVGPRPVVPGELERYGPCAQYYMQVRPGLTGLWQVSGRNQTTYRERVMFDASYVINGTIIADLTIILKTFAEVLWKRSGV